jgi:hypothetical protein
MKDNKLKHSFVEKDESTETFLNECIKQQKYDFVNNYRDKQKHIIKEINDIERIEIKDIENIFYSNNTPKLCFGSRVSIVKY